MVGGLILAEPLAIAMGQTAIAAATTAPSKTTRLGPAIALAHLGLAFLIVRLIVPVVRVDGPAAPITALAHVPAAIRVQPVLNEYGQGGYLIWQGVRPFIDGRTDFYGDDFMNRFSAATAPNKAALDALLSRWGVRWTILSPGNPLVAVMDQRPGWHRIYVDRYAVVHVQD